MLFVSATVATQAFDFGTHLRQMLVYIEREPKITYIRILNIFLITPTDESNIPAQKEKVE